MVVTLAGTLGLKGYIEILPRQEMQLHPCKESKKTMIDNFLQAPAGLERLGHEICRTNQKLKRVGPGLERQEDAIELSQEETQVPGNCRPLPKLQRKLSLNK